MFLHFPMFLYIVGKHPWWFFLIRIIDFFGFIVNENTHFYANLLYIIYYYISFELVWDIHASLDNLSSVLVSSSLRKCQSCWILIRILLTWKLPLRYAGHNSSISSLHFYKTFCRNLLLTYQFVAQCYLFYYHVKLLDSIESFGWRNASREQRSWKGWARTRCFRIRWCYLCGLPKSKILY